MKIFLLIIHLVVTIALVTLILLQNSKGGLSSGLGGTGEFYRSRRGAEKLLFTATIVTAGLFLITSMLNLIIG